MTLHINRADKLVLRMQHQLVRVRAEEFIGKDVSNSTEQTQIVLLYA